MIFSRSPFFLHSIRKYPLLKEAYPLQQCLREVADAQLSCTYIAVELFLLNIASFLLTDMLSKTLLKKNPEHKLCPQQSVSAADGKYKKGTTKR